MINVCVTGSKGLIGSSVTELLIKSGANVWGIDNDSRKKVFGIRGSTGKITYPFNTSQKYHHCDFDLRNTTELTKLITSHKFHAVVHCAGQPSHSKSIDIPIEDFEINTRVTLHLLETLKNHSPNTIFIFTSSNKVYGENPNSITYIEKKSRFDFKDSLYLGVDETMSIDSTTHTPFGVSKVAADLYVQEYAKTYQMNTTVLRLGCVTGRHHASVKHHGFLSFLVKSIIHSKHYEIIGFKGKQVRDQISSSDVAYAILEIIKKPNRGGVYNLGGGKNNSLSILEAIDLITKLTGTTPSISIKEQQRIGDHRCYYTNNSKFQTSYPNWQIKDSVEKILLDIIQYECR